jgi:hypothetical protein
MNTASQDLKQHVFEKEAQVLREAKVTLKRDDLTLEELKEGFKALSHDYEILLGDSRVITNISDRLQNRLNNANEELKEKSDEIQRKSEEIHKKNELLQNTIDELTKAKIGRKAAAIVLIAVVLLFLVSEVFLEPIVDAYYGDNLLVSISIKMSIALLLKPIDFLVEWYLQKDARSKTRRSPQILS